MSVIISWECPQLSDVSSVITSVSCILNYWQIDCSFNILLRLTTKQHSSSGDRWILLRKASDAENVSISWRHHDELNQRWLWDVNLWFGHSNVLLVVWHPSSKMSQSYSGRIYVLFICVCVCRVCLCGHAWVVMYLPFSAILTKRFPGRREITLLI